MAPSVSPARSSCFRPYGDFSCLSILSQAARRNRVTLIAGLSLQEKRLRNAALVFAPDGSLIQSYNKQHLLSPYENSYTPGKDLALLETGATASAGIVICKDMDFLLPSREYSQQGTGLLLVPALDFHTDGWLHARIAILRGVEENVAVVRAAQWGLLTVSDSRGRLQGTVPVSNQDETSLLAKVQLGSGYSLYSLQGDWLAWLCLFGTSLALFRLKRK
ncbi:nitrilase-related carbon-nitrogen hydrolase [Sporomusa acidovorans]|uniref:nitrilase-related carbon-nitrogen hydrolase n=1 Tax=Sporomusa acidovorans TaxID=112900 RepID=UPI00146C20CD|nr:nitrilase-related carbon-nitrogen hydrolase [Sporomusa acidovorans]